MKDSGNSNLLGQSESASRRTSECGSKSKHWHSSESPKAILGPNLGKKYCQRTNRAVCTWGKPYREAGKVICQDHYSTFDNNVKDAIQRGAAENEVQKHVEKLSGACNQISTLRRRYERW